jgi:hypothetical protein
MDLERLQTLVRVLGLAAIATMMIQYIAWRLARRWADHPRLAAWLTNAVGFALTRTLLIAWLTAEAIEVALIGPTPIATILVITTLASLIAWRIDRARASLTH